MSNFLNFYSLLNIPIGASSEEVEAAYKNLMCEYGLMDREEEAAQVTQAYNTLIDPALRDEYTRALLLRQEMNQNMLVQAEKTSRGKNLLIVFQGLMFAYLAAKYLMEVQDVKFGYAYLVAAVLSCLIAFLLGMTAGPSSIELASGLALLVIMLNTSNSINMIVLILGLMAARKAAVLFFKYYYCRYNGTKPLLINNK